MKPNKVVATFTDKFPLIGPLMWVLSVQYFIIQFIVARSWVAVPYSIGSNTISDLGNTACGIYNERYICSPKHSLMNASFVILGTFMAIGSLFIYQEFKEKKLALLGFSFMAIAGVGTVLVGLFPENAISILHEVGAFMPFVLGNLGLVVLGLTLDAPKWLRAYTIFSGIFGLVSLLFFATHNYQGLGIGGMERLAAYPQTIWLIVFGIYMSKNHLIRIYKKMKKHKIAQS